MVTRAGFSVTRVARALKQVGAQEIRSRNCPACGRAVGAQRTLRLHGGEDYHRSCVLYRSRADGTT